MRVSLVTDHVERTRKQGYKQRANDRDSINIGVTHSDIEQTPHSFVPVPHRRGWDGSRDQDHGNQIDRLNHRSEHQLAEVPRSGARWNRAADGEHGNYREAPPPWKVRREPSPECK